MTIRFYIFSTVIFVAMIGLHIYDDFNTQSSFLAKFKQRRYWERDLIGRYSLYKNDYKMCLFIHSLQWAIAIHIPILLEFLSYFSVCPTHDYDAILFICILSVTLTLDTTLHIVIDNAKANKYKLNLCQDQIYHFLQVILTFIIWFIYIYLRFIN